VAELAALKQAGYHPIHQAQLFDALYKGAPLPPQPIIISVDDGYVDDVTRILPALERFHMVATFFVITGRMTDPGFLDADQIRQLDEARMDIGDHTAHHVDLRLLTATELRAETAGSRQVLARVLGHPVYFFAYPARRSWLPGSSRGLLVPIHTLVRGGRARKGLDVGQNGPVWHSARSSEEEIDQLCMRNLLRSHAERVFFKDLESRFLLVSAGWLEAEGQGRSLEDVVGKTDFDIFSLPHATAAFEDEQWIIRTGQPIVAKVEQETFEDRPEAWVSTTKFPLLDESGRIVGTFGIARDVTAQIEAQEALAYQALHDPVTGLANRIALMDRLAQALIALERQPGRLGLLFVDLDDFKSINDTLGHEVGDRVLIEVARRLKRIARRADTVVRFGGDEFVLLCTALSTEHDLEMIGDRVMSAIREPLDQALLGLSITGSVGAVITSDPTADPGQLLQQADIAMYAAKRAGRNGIKSYTPQLHDLHDSLCGLAVDLKLAIDRRELFVLYQPLFALKDGSLTGVEALVRWRHPERGLLLPDEFIPVAERRGMIGAVEEFVLEESCRQLREWSVGDEQRRALTLAVNVSARQVRDPALVATVASALERHRVDAAQLCLEITESALIGDLGDAYQTISSLAALGVRVALDDFGTGYSTLAHLQRLRPDILKIDRSFVSQIDRQPREREIVAAIIAMGHALGLTVIGEGIETEAQRDQLSALGCDAGQGYLFASALTAREVGALRRRARPRAGR